MTIGAEVARIKYKQDLPAGNYDGIKQVLAANDKTGQDMALPPGAAYAIWSAIAEETGKFESSVISAEKADHAAVTRQFKDMTNA